MQQEVSGSVSQWLDDLYTMTDMECMCVLQGKSLSNQATDVVFHANKSIKGKSPNNNYLKSFESFEEFYCDECPYSY